MIYIERNDEDTEEIWKKPWLHMKRVILVQMYKLFKLTAIHIRRTKNLLL